MVLDELLSNRGTAECLIAAEEHVQACLDCGNPVHALMFVKALVLNGHRSIHQGLGDFIQRGPLAISRRVNLLELLNISVVIHIINKGGPLQIVILQ